MQKYVRSDHVLQNTIRQGMIKLSYTCVDIVTMQIYVSAI